MGMFTAEDRIGRDEIKKREVQRAREVEAQQRKHDEEVSAVWGPLISGKPFEFVILARRTTNFSYVYKAPEIIGTKDVKTDAEFQAADKYVKIHKSDIEVAINTLNIINLRQLLGPSLWWDRQHAMRLKRLLLWDWIIVACEWEVLKTKVQAIVTYAKPYQTKNFKQVLIDTFRAQNTTRVVDSWELCELAELVCLNHGEELPLYVDRTVLDRKAVRSIIVGKLSKAFEDATIAIQKETIPSSIGELQELVYKLSKDGDALFQRLALVHEKLKKLQIEPTANISLSEVDCSEFPLCQLDKIQGQNNDSFLDYAITLYEEADLEQKAKIISIITILLEHGDKPSNECWDRISKMNDWSLIKLISTYIDTNTQFAELIRYEIYKYSDNTATLFFKLRNRRVTTVQAAVYACDLLKLFCSPINGASLDDSLVNAISTSSDNSNLQVKLRALVKKNNQGSYVSNPGEVTDGLAMSTFNSSRM